MMDSAAWPADLNRGDSHPGARKGPEGDKGAEPLVERRAERITSRSEASARARSASGATGAGPVNRGLPSAAVLHNDSPLLTDGASLPPPAGQGKVEP